MSNIDDVSIELRSDLGSTAYALVTRAASLLIALAAIGCAAQDHVVLPDPGTPTTCMSPLNLKQLARDAHRQGIDDTYWTIVDDALRERTLGGEAVAVVRASEVTPQSGSFEGGIVTWYEVELLRLIRPPSTLAPSRCRWPDPPPGIRPDAWHWGVVLSGGTVVVDGVRFGERWYAERRHLQPGRTYLLFGHPYERTFVPESRTRESVYEIDPDGRLQPLMDMRTDLTETIKRLGTIDAVEMWVSTPRPPEAH